MAKQLQITLKRSLIGRPEDSAVDRSDRSDLRKLNQTVVQPGQSGDSRYGRSSQTSG